MPKKMNKQGKPEVHDDLEGFDIKINSLGELDSNFNIDRLNEFLNKSVEDKKLSSKADQNSEEE